MKTKLFIYVIGIILLQGCALQIGTLNPNPQLKLTKTNQKIALLIDDEIKNSFLIPEYSGIKESKVSDWHSTLMNGFNNGFKNYFTIVNKNENPYYILKLVKSELNFVPSTVSGYNNITVLNAEINFKAILLNGQNEILNTIDETAISNKTIKIKGEEKEVIEEVIENMYIIISDKFFNK